MHRHALILIHNRACRQRHTRCTVTQLPFWTAFNRGAGPSDFQAAEQASATCWYDLSRQDVQPQLSNNGAPVTFEDTDSAPDSGSNATRSFFYEQVHNPEPVYEGGCSIKVFGSRLPGDTSACELPLFACHVPLSTDSDDLYSEDTLSLSIEYTVHDSEAEAASRLCLVVDVQGLARNSEGDYVSCSVILGCSDVSASSARAALACSRSEEEMSRAGFELPLQVTAAGEASARKAEELRAKLRAGGSKVSQLVASLGKQSSESAPGTWRLRRYRLDFTEAAELAESPGGMRLTGLSILPCFTSASEREDHSDTAPAQMFQSYLGSVLVTETSYAKSPLTSLRSCDAVLAVDWCSADSPVQLSTFLSWQTAGQRVDGSSRAFADGADRYTGAPVAFAVWLCPAGAPPTAWQLLGVTKRCTYKVASVPADRDGGALLFAVQQQHWDGSWEARGSALQMELTYAARAR